MSILGLRGLEPLLKGADLDGSVILCESPSRSETDAIWLQFVKQGLAVGEKVLVVCRESEEEVMQGLARLGIAVADELVRGDIVILDWSETAKPDAVRAAIKLPSLMEEKLKGMGAGGRKRVMVKGMHEVLSPLPSDRRQPFVSEIVGQIRSGADLGIAILDTAGFSEEALKGIYEPFDGVLRVVPDAVEEGFMIGVVTFEGVERTGIYLPLRKSEEFFAGVPAAKGLVTVVCPKCGYAVSGGQESCPQCNTDLRDLVLAAEPVARAAFEHLEKLLSEVGIKKPAEISVEDDLRRKKLEELLSSMGSVDGKQKEALRERLRSLALSRALQKTPLRAPGAAAGLTNGLAQTRRAGMVNGLKAARVGLTNGLTNGNGFTNGLGSRRFLSRARRSRWKLLVVPLVASILLLMPVIVPASLFKPTLALSADGSFSEWSSAMVFDRNATLSGSIDLTSAAIKSEDGRLGVYFEVAGMILSGDPFGQGSDLFQAFIDSDMNSGTGYFVEGIGAEYAVQVVGQNHVVLSASFLKWYFHTSTDNTDWSNWISAGYPAVAVGSGQDAGEMEVTVDIASPAPDDASSLSKARALFHSQSWNNEEDFSEFCVSSSLPSLEVIQTDIPPEVASSGNVTLKELRLRTAGGQVSVQGVDFVVQGSAVMGDISAFRAIGVNSAVLGTQAYSGGLGAIAFDALFSIGTDWQKITIEAQVPRASSRTLGVRLLNVDFIDAPNAAVSLFDGVGTRNLAYLGIIPPGVVVDGAFSDWQGAKFDFAGERSTEGNDAIDIMSFDVNRVGLKISSYVQVQGRALKGTVAPIRLSGPMHVLPSSDSDKDLVPDIIEGELNDILPLDFNNDNISDAMSNNDVDDDGVPDYPAGSDMWLNTTIPSWFGVPWGGKVVSVYIGPELAPVPNLGEDLLRVYMDTDDAAGSGYAFGGIFADYLLEVSGKNGDCSVRELSSFSGSAPLEWKWTKVGALDVAVGSREVEVQGTLSALPPSGNLSAVFDLRDWRGDSDIAGPSSRGTRGIYADGMLLGLSSEGESPDPTAIVDTSSASTSTQLHHQRKTFYDGTYFWAFYHDGSDTMYEYSSDGMSWVNSRGQAFTTSGVLNTSVWFHSGGGTKIVYLAGDSGTSSKTVLVRRGTIGGTTIAWDTEHTVTLSAEDMAGKPPFISRGVNGYLWIAAPTSNGGSQFNFAVARSTNVDDDSQWEAYTGVMSSDISSSKIFGSVLPLPGGDAYALWYANGAIAGRLYTWSSGTWGSLESIDTTTSDVDYATPSATIDSSGNIDTVYVYSNGNVLHRQRTSSWSSATTLDSSSGNQFSTISLETGSGDLYAFWKSSSSQIKAGKYSSSSWSSITLQPNTMTKSFVTSIHNVSGVSKISWAWSEVPAILPRDVRFSVMSTAVKSVTVDTSLTINSTQYSHQRKVIYDGTYYWAFYDDGGNTLYTYSSDGQTWTNGYKRAFNTTYVRTPSVWYYSSGSTKTVFIVGDTYVADVNVTVRQGSVSGSTIAWGDDYNVTVSSQGLSSKIAFICRDSAGYLWIVSNEKNNTYNLTAVRSTSADQVSSWGSYVPLTTGITNNNIYGIVVPLSGGDVYALWYADGAIDGRKYTSSTSTWESVENINTTSTLSSSKGPSIVVDSSYNVNLLFINSTGSVIYRQRTSAWGTASVLNNTTGNVYPSITLDATAGSMYAFWINSTGQIMGMKYSGGSWSPLAGIDVSTIPKRQLTTVYSVSTENNVCWLWGQGEYLPNEVKFARIPEFPDLLLPLACVLLLGLALGRRRGRRNR